MKRRDMILIAVLINAGLLIVLFATALKSDDGAVEMAQSLPQAPPKMTEIPIRKDPIASTGDEVDRMLNQMAQAPKEPLAAVVQTAPAANDAAAAAPIATLATIENNSSPSFADDLKAITSSETPAITMNTSVAAPAIVEKPAEKSETSFTEVKVKKGDVLEKIARHNHTTVDEIMKHNHLANTRLKIGQVLKIQSKSAKKSVAKAASSEQKQSDAAKYYTVKNGDNPWTIAVKNHMKVEELLKLNGLNEEKARKLKPGDQLRIR